MEATETAVELVANGMLAGVVELLGSVQTYNNQNITASKTITIQTK
jgi:hypothetical protein